MPELSSSSVPLVARILHLEDSDLDAELVRERLLAASVRVEIDRVYARDAFIERLQSQAYDLILADFRLPGFDGFAALDLARQRAPDTPFVFLSGAMGEEVAIEALKNGATDYVLKQRLAKLPGAITRALAEAHERTERKEAQRRLAQSAADLKEAQRIARLGSWTWNVATDCISASDEFWRLFGVDHPESMQTFASHRATFYPESWDTLNSAIHNGAGTGTYEVDIPAMRGTERIWLTARGEVSTHDGKVTLVRSTVQDITERMRTEELLRQNNATTALLRAAVESANDAVMITEPGLDKPGPRIEYVNEAFTRMTGYTIGEVLGKTPRILQGDKTDRDLMNRLREDLTTRREFMGETTNYRKDGTPYVVEWRITAVRDERGEVQRWVAVQRDVTERRLADEVAREADRRKDEFIATLAHELRNPLAPIRNGMTILRLDGTGAPSEVLNMMDRQLSHLVRLVDDLLDVSRVISGKVVLKREVCSIRSVIEAAVETSLPLIAASNHRLAVSLPEEILLADVDPTRIAQVVSNLLNNSAKYTPEAGNIELKVTADDTSVIVRVRDEGIGIPTEMLPKVFDLFTQVGRSLDRSQGGLGVGLSLVKRLVELHGGRIEAFSHGPGAGSTFTLWLPRARERRTTPRSAAAVAAAPAPLRVLIVDDNVDAATSMASMLKLSGHETQVVFDGQSALELGKQFHPDIVFLDIGMPQMDGYEVARAARNDKAFDQVTLVALTGWGSVNDQQRAKDAGFDFHLTKPVELAAVAAVLAGLKK